MGKKSKSRDAESNATPKFEQCLEKLEGLVRRLEDGQLGLSESLECYEQALKWLKQCYQALERAERKIELLAGFDAEGNPITEPLDDSETTLQEKALSRAERRSRSSAEDASNAAEKPGELF